MKSYHIAVIAGDGIGREVVPEGMRVLEAVAAFERASGRRVPYVVAPRRAGDVASCWADPARAARELGWQARRGLDEMCADAWAWQERNPQGYPD